MSRMVTSGVTGMPQTCLSCFRAGQRSAMLAVPAAAVSQRGKHRVGVFSKGVIVKLLQDIPGYGPKGINPLPFALVIGVNCAIMRIAKGRQRNLWGPRALATMITDKEFLKQGLRETDLRPRDPTFLANHTTSPHSSSVSASQIFESATAPHPDEPGKTVSQTLADYILDDDGMLPRSPLHAPQTAAEPLQDQHVTKHDTSSAANTHGQAAEAKKARLKAETAATLISAAEGVDPLPKAMEDVLTPHTQPTAAEKAINFVYTAQDPQPLAARAAGRGAPINGRGAATKTAELRGGGGGTLLEGEDNLNHQVTANGNNLSTPTPQGNSPANPRLQSVSPSPARTNRLPNTASTPSTSAPASVSAAGARTQTRSISGLSAAAARGSGTTLRSYSSMGDTLAALVRRYAPPSAGHVAAEMMQQKPQCVEVKRYDGFGDSAAERLEKLPRTAVAVGTVRFLPRYPQEPQQPQQPQQPRKFGRRVIHRSRRNLRLLKGRAVVRKFTPAADVTRETPRDDVILEQGDGAGGTSKAST